MNKGIDIKSIKKVLRNFFNSNIIVSSTFMIGYPKENIFNIYKTLNFIKKFKYIDVFGLNIFVLSRNSILYNELGFKSNNINLIYRFKNSNSLLMFLNLYSFTFILFCFNIFFIFSIVSWGLHSFLILFINITKFPLYYHFL